MISRSALVLPLLASLAGCGEGSYQLEPGRGPGPPSRPRLWTSFDLYRALQDNAPVGQSAAFPGGFPADSFLTPTATGASLRVIPAFSEAGAAAYVVTEIWAGFEEIWVQPWYFLVTAWDDKSAQMNRLKKGDVNTPAIFDVGPRSRFYSPFWQLFYVLVPKDTPPEQYDSAEQLFDDKLPMFASTPFVYAVHPPEVAGDNKLLHPYLNIEVGVLTNNPAGSIVDREVMSYFALGGGNNFRYDARLVVEEVPLYRMTKRRAGDGAPEPIPGAADVVGSVPAFSRRAAEVVAGRPRFGGYTRLHVAIAPATAAAFDAAASPMAVAALMEKMEDPKIYQGRVATDRACFALPTFPMGCTWLDSQAKIEDQLARANILRTDVTMASSLVVFAGKGIGR